MRKINICFTADEEYGQSLCVALVSLFRNTAVKENKTILIIDTGLSEMTRREIVRISERNGSTVTFFTRSLKPYAGLITNAHANHTNYLRLEIPSLFPDLERVLYLDCDITVRGDIDKVYCKDLQGKTIGAVHDFGSYDFSRLGIPERRFYFNSGVLLFDVKKWNEKGVSEQIKKFIQKQTHLIKIFDQDILNAILWDDWADIGIESNLQAILLQKNLFFFSSLRQRNLYRSAVVIHYSLRKPWDYFCDTPHKREYFKYIKGTMWKDFAVKRPPIKTIIKHAYCKFSPLPVQKAIRKYILSPVGVKRNLLGK